MSDAPPDMDELLNRARTLLAQHEVDSWLATRSEVRMADTIRDLLGEVERLQYLAHHRLEMFNQRASLIREVQGAAQKAEARAEAAESRLRELASAKPVAWIERGLIEAPDSLVWSRGSVGHYTPLIRRPEMPS